MMRTEFPAAGEMIGTLLLNREHNLKISNFIRKHRFRQRTVDTIQFLEPIILQLLVKFKEVNQHLYELEQCQKNNWTPKMDPVNRL